MYGNKIFGLKKSPAKSPEIRKLKKYGKQKNGPVIGRNI